MKNSIPDNSTIIIFYCDINEIHYSTKLDIADLKFQKLFIEYPIEVDTKNSYDRKSSNTTYTCCAEDIRSYNNNDDFKIKEDIEQLKKNNFKHLIKKFFNIRSGKGNLLIFSEMKHTIDRYLVNEFNEYLMNEFVNSTLIGNSIIKEYIMK